MKTDTELLSPSEVSHVLGVSYQRVRQLTNSGRLPAMATPLGRVYDAALIRAYANERARRSAHPGGEHATAS